MGIKIKSILAFAFSIFASSCADNSIKPSEGTFNKIFNQFWEGVNENYVFWDRDTVDWDNKYIKYKPLFNDLDINSNIDCEKSVVYFTDMTKNLIDGHFRISFSNSYINNFKIDPSFTRRQRVSNFRYQFSYIDIDKKYLTEPFYFSSENNSKKSGPLRLLSGKIGSDILYLSISNFFLTSYFSDYSSKSRIVLNYFFEELDSLNSFKGIIIDVRGNSGGDVEDLAFLIGKLIHKPLHFGDFQSKSGSGRLDYTIFMKALLYPTGEKKMVDLPIVVLGDTFSASLAETFIMALSSLPKCIFLGESTWGATGFVTDQGVFNAGYFQVLDFLSVSMSSGRFINIDGNSYEGVGYPPDIYLPFDSNSINSGRDLQLEKAIEIINE